MSQAQKPIEYPFYADGIVEFGYLVEEDVYYIVYRDTTNFPDFLITIEDEDDWYEEMYISLECTDEDFFDYLFWFAKERLVKSNAFYEEDPRYYITEIITEVKGGINHRYKLNRK